MSTLVIGIPFDDFSWNFFDNLTMIRPMDKSNLTRVDSTLNKTVTISKRQVDRGKQITEEILADPVWKRELILAIQECNRGEMIARSRRKR